MKGRYGDKPQFLVIYLFAGILLAFNISSTLAQNEWEDVRLGCSPGLEKAVNEAVIRANSGQSIRILLAPCIYRERIVIRDLHGPGKIEIRAEIPGTAVISGSDILTGWLLRDGTWSTEWRHDLGEWWPESWPDTLPNDEVLRHAETFFINGARLYPVASFDELQAQSFFVDEKEDRVFIRTDTSLDKQLVEGTVRHSLIEVSHSENVTIWGLVVQHAASRVQRWYAIEISESSNILLSDLVVQDNSGIGLGVNNSHAVTTRRIQFIDNGYTGYSAWKVTKLVSDGDTVRGSNWRGFPRGMVGWSVAGLKHLRVRDAVYRNLTSVNNFARGFWLDTDIKGVLIEGGRICGNARDGVFLEKIQGPVVLRSITVCNNVSEGIKVSSARNITIDKSNIAANGEAQIYFTGRVSEQIRDFESGMKLFVYTENWSITNSTLTATGEQSIVAIRSNLGPRFLLARNNVCTSDSTGSEDSLVCANSQSPEKNSKATEFRGPLAR